VVVLPGETIGTVADAWSSTNPGQQGWYFGDIRNSGTVGITKTYDRTSAAAAAAFPGSQGSLEFNLTSGADKGGLNQYFNSSAAVAAFPLLDLVGAAYDWFRSSSSTNSAGQAPALFFSIDTKTADGVIGVKYEPTYNGFGSSLPTDAWQTSTITGTTNLWSWNAPGRSWVFNIALQDWKTIYPNALVTGMGVDAGSGWNGVFSGAVDFITVDRTGTANDLFFDFQVADAAVPEPGTLAIWGTFGGLGLIAARRRRRGA
jgi:hypothetical protein